MTVANPVLIEAALTATDLSFSTQGKTLLDGVSLSVRRGSVVGLIGHNGSGKSTLLKLLARQLRPTTGAVRVDGHPVTEFSERAFARKVAYLPQDTSLASDMTAEELVRCGRYAWHGALGRVSDEDREKVAEAMRRTGTDGLAKRMVNTLSGGERQRVWLAMLVAQNAGYLLLDEPISALDVSHQIEVMTLVRDMSRLNVGVVVVLHDINMAARFCDHLYALKGGALIRQGSTETLMTADNLTEIYYIGFEVMAHPRDGKPLAYVV